MKNYKQLLSELTSSEEKALEKLLAAREDEKRVGFHGKMTGDPDSYLDDMRLSKRAPKQGSALSYRQEREGPSGFLGGLAAKALSYGAEFSQKHGYTPIAGKIKEPALRTYDPKASIKANERGGEIRNQIMANHKAQKTKIDAAYKADLAALNKKKGSMDPAAHAARVQELGKKRQAGLTALAKETSALAKGTRTRAAHLKQYYGYKGKGQNITPDEDRGFEGGYVRY